MEPPNPHGCNTVIPNSPSPQPIARSAWQSAATLPAREMRDLCGGNDTHRRSCFRLGPGQTADSLSLDSLRYGAKSADKPPARYVSGPFPATGTRSMASALKLSGEDRATELANSDSDRIGPASASTSVSLSMIATERTCNRCRVRQSAQSRVFLANTCAGTALPGGATGLSVAGAPSEVVGRLLAGVDRFKAGRSKGSLVCA